MAATGRHDQALARPGVRRLEIGRIDRRRDDGDRLRAGPQEDLAPRRLRERPRSAPPLRASSATPSGAGPSRLAEAHLRTRSDVHAARDHQAGHPRQAAGGASPPRTSPRRTRRPPGPGAHGPARRRARRRTGVPETGPRCNFDDPDARREGIAVGADEAGRRGRTRHEQQRLSLSGKVEPARQINLWTPFSSRRRDYRSVSNSWASRRR